MLKRSTLISAKPEEIQKRTYTLQIKSLKIMVNTSNKLIHLVHCWLTVGEVCTTLKRVLECNSAPTKATITFRVLEVIYKIIKFNKQAMLTKSFFRLRVSIVPMDRFKVAMVRA